MGADHRTAGTGKGVIADGNAAYDFRRVLRDPCRRKQVSTVGRLPEGKAGFSAASHIPHFCVLPDGDAAALAGIVVDIGAISDHDITGSIACSVGIGNAGPFPDGHILCFRRVTAGTDRHAAPGARRRIRRRQHRICPSEGHQAQCAQHGCRPLYARLGSVAVPSSYF